MNNQPVHHGQHRFIYWFMMISIVLAGFYGVHVQPNTTTAMAAGAAPGAAEGQWQIYLPVTQSAAAALPPPPPPIDGRFFLQRETWTNRTRVAVDRAGGIHMVYQDAGPIRRTTSPAYYSYCPPGGNCASAAGFRTVELSDNMTDVQLALTADGKPRLLLERDGPSTIGSFGVVYDYAACDQNCTSAAQWAFVRVARSSYIDTNRVERPWRVFALDGQGRPRFVYYNGSVSFYVSCDANCLTNPPEAPHWTETPLTLPSGAGGDIPRMTLAVTAGGQTRMLGEVYTNEAPGAGFYFLACEAECAQSESWERVKLAPIDGVVVAQHDLEITSGGGLRAVAMFYRPVPDGPYPSRLFYLACDTDCLNADSWLGDTVGLQENDGEFADLELDAQNRPRIAYRRDDGGGLGYLWCDNQCETGQAQWQAKAADQSSSLEQELESYEFASCQKGVWSTGWLPALALDPQGNPRIGVEALQIVRCYAQPNPTDPVKDGINTFRFSRLVVMQKP